MQEIIRQNDKYENKARDQNNLALIGLRTREGKLPKME